jgi:predicted phosphodiesterase
VRTLGIAVALPVVVGIAGAWVGVAAFGHDSVTLGPFRVRLDASLGRGVTDIGLPPLGTLRADTHVAPLHLRATLQSVDVEQLRPLVSEPLGPTRLAADLEAAALDRIWPFTLRVLATGAFGAFVVGALVFRTGHRAFVALVAGVLAIGGSEALAYATFDPSAFLTPSYSGTLSLAPQLFGPVEGTVARFDYFRNELERIVASAGRAYAAIEANPLGRGDEIRVLHISDIHLSLLGYTFAERLAESFDIDLVLDTGDTGSFGTRAEQLILNEIPKFDLPYVWVRGSHDSLAFQQAVTGYDDAHVLDGTTDDVAGLTFYGLGDPYFVQARGAPKADDEIQKLVEEAGPVILDDVEGLSEPPDVVAVHDDRMAEAVAGRVPLVLSGHFHENASHVIDGTLFLRVGTTGGAGPTGFTAEGGIPLSAEILSFRPGADGVLHLVAWDVVEQDPATGSFSVVRHRVEAEYGDLTPSPPPTEEPTQSASATSPIP